VSTERSTPAVSQNLPALGRDGASASAPHTDAERQKIADAALQFEAMFLLQMLKQMRQSMLEDESEEPGLGAGTMFETIDAELAQRLSGQRGGLAPMLMDAMANAADRATTASAPSRVNAVSTAPMAPSHTVAVAAGASESAASAGSTVTSSYGWRHDPFTGAAKFHSGVDIRASYGQDVGAAAGGRVVFAGEQGGYGQSVIVEHASGLQTRYAHLSSIEVENGQTLEPGHVVGRVGQSGRATGPHLHFEVLKNGRAVNPATGGQLLATVLKGPLSTADYPAGSPGLRAGVSGVEQ
jgi:murein DD-endopeptidase MepM/ murein hydrolase activator NlpD